MKLIDNEDNEVVRIANRIIKCFNESEFNKAEFEDICRDNINKEPNNAVKHYSKTAQKHNQNIYKAYKLILSQF